MLGGETVGSKTKTKKKKNKFERLKQAPGLIYLSLVVIKTKAVCRLLRNFSINFSIWDPTPPLTQQIDKLF